MRRLLLLAPLALVLAACDARDGKQVNPKDNVLPSGYRVIVLPYEGQGVRCIKMTRSTTASGLACDFAEFHHRFGWHNRYYSRDAGDSGG